MKVVVDTNVFISGVFFTGPPHQILDAWRRGRVQIVVAPEILTEYHDAELNDAFSMLQALADSMFQSTPTILGYVGLVFRSQKQ